MKAYYSILGNLLFPGLGHYYIGEKVKAACFALIILFTYCVGLGLDFQHYYWYEGVSGAQRSIFYDPSAPAHTDIRQRVNPQFDEGIRIFSVPKRTSSKFISLGGHTTPGLTLELINQKSLDKIQVQADYKGFFQFEPLELHDGENPIMWRVADQFYAEPAGRQIDVPHFNSTNARYKPGTLEKLWHFIYKVVFPVLTTPLLHFGGGFFQGLVIDWWDQFPLVKNETSIPAPLRDVGFYFAILTCMFNLLILFDGFDTCFNNKNRKGRF